VADNKRAGGNLGWIFHLNDESGGVCDLRFYQYRASSAGDWITTSREVTINAWNHIAISFDSDNTSNNPSIYVNGTLVALTQTGSQSGAITSDASVDMYIGGEAGAYSFDGKMCDFKLFNSVLTEAQVQELYKKPENTPSAVRDNLVAWYPMIEGNPESPQSIVYDHSEKKLGSELSNKDFTGWTLDGSSNWSASSATSLSHTASSAGFASSPFSTVSGKIYKVSITINSGQTGTYKLQLGASSWLFDPTDGNDTWSGEMILGLEVIFFMYQMQVVHQMDLKYMLQVVLLEHLQMYQSKKSKWATTLLQISLEIIYRQELGIILILMMVVS
jgi:hypothetical protein